MDGKAFSGLLGLMAAALSPDEAEASPAVKGFASTYDRAVRDGSKKMMYAGTLEPDVFEQAVRRDPAITQNVVKVGTHGGQARMATGEMEPLEVGQHIENLLDSGETRVLPNFPSANYRNNARGMFYLNDGKDIVSPFSGGSGGDIILRTAFEPQADRKKFIESYLGRPMSPISGIRNNPASAQPQGLSAVRQPSDASTVPGTPSFDKEKMAVLAVPASAWASTPVDMSPTMFDRVMRDMGIGARGVVEGLGTGATLGMGNPGRYVADWLNLPEARTETEKRRKGTVQGIADAVPMIAGGAGAARAALSPVVRGVGASLASTPKTDAALGGLLDYFMGGD